MENNRNGIKQRIQALNLFLKDIYNEQFILKDKVFPTSLLISNNNFRKKVSLKFQKIFVSYFRS